MLLVVLGVAFVYCGGSNVPAVLRNNKQLLGGVVVGLFLCSFFGMRVEGLPKNVDDENPWGDDAPCQHGTRRDKQKCWSKIAKQAESEEGLKEIVRRWGPQYIPKMDKAK